MSTTTYIYVLRPTRLAMLTSGATAEEDAIIERHSDYLAELARQRRVVFYGRTLTEDEKTFGIVVFSAASAEEAQQTMEADPAVRNGVMQAECFPFRIVGSR